MEPDNTTALSIRRWLLFSGWLEICVGLGHNVVGSLIIAILFPISWTVGFAAVALGAAFAKALRSSR